MNILILNWRDPKNPNSGGAEIVTLEYARGWIKEGHNVTWFSSSFSGAKREEIVNGIKIIRFGSQALGVQCSAFFWYIFSNHEPFDIVIDQIHGIPFFTPLYVRRKKIAFIHEVAKEVWKFNPWPKPFHIIPSFLGMYGEPWIFKFFYRNIPFLTVSESTKEELQKWGILSEKITVIHNGLTLPNNLMKYNKEKRKTIICLGAISKDKGIENILKAFSTIYKNESDWQLWIVGRGEAGYIRDIKLLCRTLQIEAATKFWNYVSEQKKIELLQKAHVLLSASVREGWGLIIIEAASQGTPAIVYNVAGLRDSVQNGKTGIVVHKNLPEELAKEALSLLNDKRRYEVMQINCKEWSKHFNWIEAVKKSIQLINSVCFT